MKDVRGTGFAGISREKRERGRFFLVPAVGGKVSMPKGLSDSHMINAELPWTRDSRLCLGQPWAETTW